MNCRLNKMNKEHDLLNPEISLDRMAEIVGGKTVEPGSVAYEYIVRVLTACKKSNISKRLAIARYSTGIFGTSYSSEDIASAMEKIWDDIVIEPETGTEDA